MKKNITKLILVVVTLILGNFISIGQTFAAGRAIALSPMHQKVVLYPGEIYHGALTVANPNDAMNDLHYLAAISTYYPIKASDNDHDYSGADYNTKTSRNIIVDWSRIDNPTGTIQPNDQATVSFTIEVPDDAPAGGQYMAILVREDPEYTQENDDSVNVNEVMQMAHIIYAEVAGETRREGIIVNNSIPSLLLNDKLEAVSTVRNNGNIHTDAEFILQVWPLWSNEEICTNEENPNTSMVMPDTEHYHTEACALPSVGIFRARQTVKIFGEESIVEKTIIVCPIWLLFIIIFVIIAIIIWIVMRVRSKNNKARKAKEMAE